MSLSSNSNHGAQALPSFQEFGMVLPWFFCNCFAKQPFQIFLAAPVSKRRLDVNLIVGKKAGTKLAVCCESEAIARRAKMVAEGTDKTDFSPG